MPELPDLQAYSVNLNKTLKGEILKGVELRNLKKVNVSIDALKERLIGKELSGIERVGKELHFKFKDGPVLGLHLMLHGKLYFFEGRNEHKFTLIEMNFENKGLALTDFQTAATVTLDPAERDVPDAMDVDAAYLKKKLALSKAPVKTVLIDQKVVRGIGNAYADEILWHARLSPYSVSKKIPEASIKKLSDSIKEVLDDAEKQILKTQPDIINGEVRDFFEVHHVHKKKTSTGFDIHQDVISSRKTYFTDEQERFD